MLPYLLFSLLFLGLSAASFRHRHRLQQSLRVIAGTEVARLGDLRALVDHVAVEIGQGAYQERVALRGAVHCGAPLTAPLSQQDCVYYKTRITERYKARRTIRDRDGNRRQEWRNGSSVLSTDEVRSPFYLQDPSDRVRVEPEGFEIEGTVVVEQFEPVSGTDSHPASLKAELTPRHERDYRTLGYHYREEILALDTPVYILGNLSDADGLAVRSGVEPPGLITHRSQQAVIDRKQKAIRQATGLSAVLLALSLGMLAYGLYQVLTL